MAPWLIALVSNLPAIAQEIVALVEETAKQGTPTTSLQMTRLAALMDVHNSIASALSAHAALPAAK